MSIENALQLPTPEFVSANLPHTILIPGGEITEEGTLSVKDQLLGAGYPTTIWTSDMQPGDRPPKDIAQAESDEALELG